MKYYPVNLDLIARCCLVVGGGSVGVRKVAMLFDSGAKVTVVSPLVNPDITRMADRGLIVLKRKKYELSDLLKCFMVIGATNNESVNRRISKDAEKHNILCNIVDKPELCSFILPAIVRRGDFVLAISTSGKSPAFSRKIRQDLELVFGPEYGLFLELMGAIRVKLLRDSHDPDKHKSLFRKLLANDLLSLVKEGNVDVIDSILHSILGPGYNYKHLMK